jgi:hypothetical protein
MDNLFDRIFSTLSNFSTTFDFCREFSSDVSLDLRLLLNDDKEEKNERTAALKGSEWKLLPSPLWTSLHSPLSNPLMDYVFFKKEKDALTLIGKKVFEVFQKEKILLKPKVGKKKKRTKNIQTKRNKLKKKMLDRERLTPPHCKK